MKEKKRVDSVKHFLARFGTWLEWLGVQVPKLPLAVARVS